MPTYKSLLTIVAQVFLCSLLLGIWEVAGRWSEKVFFLVGSPVSVGLEFGFLLFEGGLIFHLFITGAEALVGMILGTAVGCGIGSSLWYSEAGARVSRPVFLALGSVPVFAFAPLMIM